MIDTTYTFKEMEPSPPPNMSYYILFICELQKLVVLVRKKHHLAKL